MTQNRLRTLALAGTLTLGGVISVAASPAGASHHKKKLPSPRIGQVAKDGDFAFKVTGEQCGVTTLGTNDPDQGEIGYSAPVGTSWCLVTVTVKADKAVSQTFFINNQYAIDKKGRQLSADADHSFYIPQDQNVDGETVNPGISISVVIPFQLATGDTISKFVFHDSAFSGGVTVYNVI